jgi:hypothetical protein
MAWGRRWGTSINSLIVSDTEDTDNEFEEYEDKTEAAPTVPNSKDTVDVNGKLLNQQPAYGKILHSEVSLQLREAISIGKVTKRAIGPDGTIAGTYNENPYLNLMIYKVEFPDEELKEYAANMIVEKNMLTQVDSDGDSLTMLNAVIGY